MLSKGETNTGRQRGQHRHRKSGSDPRGSHISRMCVGPGGNPLTWRRRWEGTNVRY